MAGPDVRWGGPFLALASSGQREEEAMKAVDDVQGAGGGRGCFGGAGRLRLRIRRRPGRGRQSRRRRRAGHAQAGPRRTSREPGER